MNSILYAALVVLCTALMGSSFAVGKIGLTWVSPLLLVGLRFTIAGALMAVATGRRAQPRGRDWLRAALIGLLQTGLVMGCIFLSLRTIPAGESSILTFTNPLLVVLLSSLFLGARYRPLQWLGVLLGLAGVVLTLGLHVQVATGLWLGLGAALSWAVATLLVKRWGARFDVWVLSAYQMLFGGLALLIAGVTLEPPKLILTGAAVAIVLWLALAASIVQFGIWYYLLNQGDPGKTSAFLFLAPFFGVVTGWALLGEHVGWNVLMGGLCIILGIFAVNWQPRLTRKVQRLGAVADRTK
jgi:probable blue pigment (indigoidine) exporter